jgi:glucose/arabinose dehydrogenase
VISGLHTALGLLWVGDALYVASSGGVAAYSGFSGTAFASQRTILALPAGVGEVNELVLGPDGRLRLGVSSPCDHCVPTSADSAAVLSFATDGSDLKVEAAGIRAPVGLAYAPGTSELFVTMNQRDDLGDLTPGDWLAVVSAGQGWGFPACYGEGGSACSGVPDPVAVLDKHAAVSGVAIVVPPLTGTSGTAAIVAEWAAGKVQRVSLAGSGSTTTGTVGPFITGMANPVPVLLAPDGSLFIGDWKTGTIYRVVGS